MSDVTSREMSLDSRAKQGGLDNQLMKVGSRGQSQVIRSKMIESGDESTSPRQFRQNLIPSASMSAEEEIALGVGARKS